MRFVACVALSVVTASASWTTYRGSERRTGRSPLTGRFGPSGPTVLASWVVWSSGNSVYGSPSAYDYDGDGLDDMLVPSHSSYATETLYHGYDAAVMWQSTIVGSGYYATQALADVTGDGRPEVFETLDTGGLYCLDGANGTTRWTYGVGPAGYPSPLTYADTSGYYVVAANDAGTLYSFNAVTGALLWSYAVGGTCYSAPSKGDVNGDGVDELVFGAGTTLCVLDLAGNLLWSTNAGGTPTTVALANADGDAALEMFTYVESSGDVVRFDYGGASPTWSRFVGTYAWGASMPTSVALGRFNWDTIPDVIAVSGDGLTLYALDGINGVVLWTTAVQAGDQLLGPPVVADMDGQAYYDYKDEVIAVGANSLYEGVVYYVQTDGTVAWRWEDGNVSWYEIENEAALGDFDGDGALEVGFADYSCFAWILDVDDPLATSELGARGALEARLLPTGVSLTLPAASRVTLTVFDAAGRVVSVPFTGALSRGTHEVSLGVLPAGVYLVRMESGFGNVTLKGAALH